MRAMDPKGHFESPCAAIKFLTCSMLSIHPKGPFGGDMVIKALVGSGAFIHPKGPLCEGLFLTNPPLSGSVFSSDGSLLSILFSLI